MNFETLLDDLKAEYNRVTSALLQENQQLRDKIAELEENVEPPVPSDNLLPTTLHDGNISNNWQFEEDTVNLTSGEYLLTADVQCFSWTGLEAKINNVVVGQARQQAGPVTLNVPFTLSSPGNVTIRMGGWLGFGHVEWANGKLTKIGDGGTQEPPLPEPLPDPLPPPPSGEFKMMLNVAGAEFGANPVGTMNHDYIYADNAYFDAVIALADWKGFRLPFKWTRVQPSLMGPLAPDHLTQLDRIISHVTGKGLILELDGHDYGRGPNGDVIDAVGPVTADHYADLWGKLAARYGNNPLVWYNTNEPHDQSADDWFVSAQKMIDAIRSNGGKGKILLPGSHWTGAHSWVNSGNARDYLENPFEDPLNNWCFDMHQYFNWDSSGLNDQIIVGAGNRCDEAIAWCQQNGCKLRIGEFAFPDNVNGHREAKIMLDKLVSSGVCVGASYWASGPWWGNDWNIVGPGKGNGQLNTLRLYM